jgi:hypothetical protein
MAIMVWFTRVSVLGSAVLSLGCQAKQPPATAPAQLSAVEPTTAPATQPVAAKPFLISEADLPAGFPGPGAVDQIVIKSYPAARAVVVQSSDLGGKGSNGLFRVLFKHIDANDIPMTAPVEMKMTPDDKSNWRVSSMAFYYPSTDRAPGTAQGAEHVADLPPARYLSIGVRGSYSAANMKAAVERLKQWIAQQPNPPKVIGEARYLGYNSPFVPPFMQYGEVQLPIE